MSHVQGYTTANGSFSFQMDLRVGWFLFEWKFLKLSPSSTATISSIYIYGIHSQSYQARSGELFSQYGAAICIKCPPG